MGRVVTLRLRSRAGLRGRPHRFRPSGRARQARGSDPACVGRRLGAGANARQPPAVQAPEIGQDWSRSPANRPIRRIRTLASSSSKPGFPNKPDDRAGLSDRDRGRTRPTCPVVSRPAERWRSASARCGRGLPSTSTGCARVGRRCRSRRGSRRRTSRSRRNRGHRDLASTCLRARTGSATGSRSPVTAGTLRSCGIGRSAVFAATSCHMTTPRRTAGAAS
jgi:hypothetical protein